MSSFLHKKQDIYKRILLHFFVVKVPYKTHFYMLKCVLLHIICTYICTHIGTNATMLQK